MSQDDDHIRGDEEDPARTLDAGKPLYELGSSIGSYKLLRILGEGGFGIVYLAQQERPIKRQVALKIIKPGMDSAQVIRRFEAERQALALLDHPNVAHVYDAGTTEAGRPYFAMEYVKGVPITEHCDRQKLTIEERLRLFVQVCEAIQHAHQKGIIHRDIKPSNIQVCIEGEQAIPKVIDFGVAKALSQPLTERTLVTEQGQLIGTPEYISPEQAEMTNQDIDTRSDIYSLGVLLYELLTGTLPFESQTLRQGSLDQMRQIIRETEPKTPSTRVSSLDAEALTRVVKCCQSDVPSLRRRLRGDLDWITLKAMEKDRMRRYQTAHALAEDIERHLNNEPVSAGRPGTLYRFQKLVRRNKAVFAAAVVVAAALVIGLTISVASLIREQRARRIAVAAEEVAVRAQETEAAQRQKAEALAYASDMSLAQQSLAMNDLGRARRLLKAHRPAPGTVPDWEWRYLWQQCRSDALGELYRYPPSADRVAYSPDGKTLAVSSRRSVDVWDVSSRPPIKRTLRSNGGFLVTFSPQGDLLAAGAGDQVQLWRTGTWDLIGQPLALGGHVCAIEFSPDGKRLGSVIYPDQLTVWEIDGWAKVRQVGGVRTLTYGGTLAFSPDGRALAAGDADHRLRVFDLASGNTDVNIPEAHAESITALAWSPNGSVIASGSGFTSGAIRLSEAASGRLLGYLEGHTSWISQLVFSTDGRRLYSASGDQTIRIWDMEHIEQRQPLATLRGSQDEVIGLALSPDGTTLASACKDGVVAFWDARPRREEQQPRLIPLGELPGPAFGRLGGGVLGRLAWPAFAPDSRVLAAPSSGTVRLFDLAAAKEMEQIPELGTDVQMVVYAPDGALLVSGSTLGKIRVWSCAEHRPVRELEEHKDPILGLYFRADGKRLLSVDAKGKAIWWDVLTWHAGQPFVVKSAEPGNWPAVSPDGRLLAVADRGDMRWLDGETGELLVTTPWRAAPGSASVVFSHDGTRAASVSAGGTLAIWDTSSRQPLIAPFKGQTLGAHAAAFSADGRRLATGSNGREAVKLWDMSTYRELVALRGEGSMFFFVAFSPDSRWLAACSWEGQLHLWRAPSWAEIEAAEKKEGSHGPGH